MYLTSVQNNRVMLRSQEGENDYINASFVKVCSILSVCVCVCVCVRARVCVFVNATLRVTENNTVK